MHIRTRGAFSFLGLHNGLRGNERAGIEQGLAFIIQKLPHPARIPPRKETDVINEMGAIRNYINGRVRKSTGQ